MKKILPKKTTDVSVYSLLNIKGQKRFLEYSEPYRNIRTNIEFSINDREIKTISVTSTKPSEAKTTTVINLAIVFAHKYAKVLIIDCDLRKPKTHKYLKLTNKTGLSNALKDFSQTQEINEEYFQQIKRSNFVGDLSVLTAGKKVANPNELLSSSTFKHFIDKLRDSYDYILFDCPPIISVSDAIPVGNAVDGTLFVYSCADTKKQEAISAINTLKQNNVYILGTVLTKASSYFSNYHYYSYSYSESK